MKLKELKPILTVPSICLYFGIGNYILFFKTENRDYVNKQDRNIDMFKKYGEREIESLYDGGYYSICIDLK